MTRTLRKIGVMLSVYYSYMTEFRSELFLWMLASVLPFILLGLWINVLGGKSYQGYDPAMMARYFLAAFLVRQFTLVWVTYEFEIQVVEGKLSSSLLQPIDPVWRHVAGHIAERGARLPFVGVVIVVFFALYPKAFFIPSVSTVALFAAVTLLVFTLRFANSYAIAMASFWVERASAFENLWALAMIAFSGMIAPLEVYPPAMRAAIMYTPFPYMIYFPARILIAGDLGKSNLNLPQGLLVMLGWTVGFVILNRLLWRAGMKRYTGMGA